jgi:ribosomal protein L40E
MGAVVDIALTAVMVIMPAAMFIGLWRLLVRMRDDELIERLDQRMKHADGAGRPGTPTATGKSPLEPSDLDPELDGRIARRMRREDRTIRCPDCGTPNGPRDEECRACGTELRDADGDGLLARFGH